MYYAGDFPAYRKMAEQNGNDAWTLPIYVGKAIPVGARRGGYGLSDLLAKYSIDDSANTPPRSNIPSTFYSVASDAAISLWTTSGFHLPSHY